MRILHVTEASSAGVLTAVTKLSREQARLSDDHEISMAYLRRPDTPSTAAIEAMVTPRVRVFEWAATTGFPRMMVLVKKLIMAMRSGHYDIIHLHSSRAGFVGRFVGAIAGRRDVTVYSPHCFAFAQTGNTLPRPH